MVRRGEIYWFDFSPGEGSAQAGRRPALVIQRDLGNQNSPTTVVAAITSRQRPRPYPFHVAFTAEESGLSTGGLVLCEQIRTVDQRLLGPRAGWLGSEKMREVDAALRWNLDLDDRPVRLTATP